ncbi:TonB-dependent receptor [Alteromonas sp.]|uniref:TonB-dependent receptor n=1 Tax=Alteromonas sp. TaxID=232 RepID=UPI000B6AC162|nr:TonB-dependent receptor [Alteromonas sp.]MAI38801.1 TonB-dependent receptor [Alteromonas sp.]OUX85322.1 MAG: TonB-dependent receptor [Alteromonas sp. TMED35]|tara:strand:+ start:9452 stop:12397 length:2946 start_codon:yes stop_codon:yes gene_type:complete
MKNTTFKKTQLATSMALLLGSTLAMPSYAQEAETAMPEEGDVEVIQVSGIRGSMIRSMDLKRSSSGVVDAISAEELGKFPDTNLAEALQRITGVTISRNNGEGNEITVRGFGPEFNLVTLNGRQMPGTGFTRSFNLSNLSSEGVNTLELQKTARAENPSGGLGATVNIITMKPLAQSGQQASFSVKGIYDTSNEEGDDVTPEVAGVYSNTFADDMFGFGVSFSHQERDFQQQAANIQGWQLQENDALPELDAENVVDNRSNITNAAFFPKDMNYSISDVQRERSNAQVTFQFRPIDDFTATVDYTASRATTGTNTVGWGIWNNFGANINEYELDANGTAVYADISGDDGSFTASRNTTRVDARSIGINLDWTVSDDWHFAVDYHDSYNEIDNGYDEGLGSSGQIILGSNQLQSKVYDYREGDIPQVFVNWNNGTNEIAPGEIDSNFSQFIYSPGRSDIEQFQLDGTWYNSAFDIPLMKVDFGVARTEQALSGFTAWSGLRGGPGFNPSFTQIFPDSMFVRNDTSGFLDAFSSGGSNMNPGYYYTYDFDEAIARQLAFITADVVGEANAYSTDPYYMGAPAVSNVEEITDSIYVQTEWDFEIGDYYVQINAGVRYEETEVPSSAEVRVPQQVNWVAASEWITQFEDGLQVQDFTGEYDVLLPMFDVKVDVTDDVVARFSWGKSITRAPIGLLQGGLAFSGSPKIGSRTASAGNTSLLPFESSNLDLSFEWYYDEASYASVGLFRKSVENYITTTGQDRQFEGLNDIYLGPRWNEAVNALEAAGTQATDSAIYGYFVDNGFADENGVVTPNADDPLITWRTTQPGNSSDAKTVEGIELAVQHTFGETGFGFGANATLVDGDVEYDPYNLEEQDPLVGISDSANFQVFYEKNGLSVKVTYAWRSDYVVGIGQAQGSSDNPATQFDTYAQVDASINYDVDEHLTVFLEGININDETERGYGRFEEQFLFARQYGPRYTLGARYTF